MKGVLFSFFLAAAVLHLCVAQTTSQCEADNCNEMCFGRSSGLVTYSTDWMAKGVNCTLCQLDCLQPGVTPFQSCPCRYYRYGCLKQNYCTSLSGLTKRQYDGAVFLCKAMGCTLKSEVLTSGDPDSKLYNVYQGITRTQSWIDVKNQCAGGQKNAKVYQLRRAFSDFLRTDAKKGKASPADQAEGVKFARCEREYYRKIAIDIINKQAPSNARLSNPAAYDQVRSEQYRNYFVQMIDLPGTFFSYFAAVAEILYKRGAADMTSFSKRLSENSSYQINMRWTLFNVRPIEVTNLINQKDICEAQGKNFHTRADAVAGLIENYIVERKALDGKSLDVLAFNDVQWHKLDDDYYRDYISMLTDFGTDIDNYNLGTDQAKEVAYPLLFPTVTDGSGQVLRDGRIQDVHVKYSPVEYFFPSKKEQIITFFDYKGSLCPSYQKKLT